MVLRSIPCAALLALSAVSVGCDSSARTAARVPDVTLEPLNAAEDTLDARGLSYDTVGGGVFGIIVRSRWTVCRQAPRPGAHARNVTLYVARSCVVPSTLVPDVVGLSLSDAEERLEQAGLEAHERSLNGDTVVVESLWTVCDQRPAPGDSTAGRTVELRVANDCWTEE